MSGVNSYGKDLSDLSDETRDEYDTRIAEEAHAGDVRVLSDVNASAADDTAMNENCVTSRDNTAASGPGLRLRRLVPINYTGSSGQCLGNVSGNLHRSVADNSWGFITHIKERWNQVTLRILVNRLYI